MPRERQEQLDREADRRGASRSSTVHQIISEWDERGEMIEAQRAEISRLREERAELRAQLEQAEERDDEDDEAPWAEQVFGVSAAAFAIFGGSTALSLVGSVLLSISGAASLVYGLALVAVSAFITALVAGAAMRRTADPDPAEEVDPDEVAG